MDEPLKLFRKYNTYVPHKKKRGAPIDWEALARSRNFFHNSAYEMFKKLYADTKEDFENGKLSVNKLAMVLGTSVGALSKALREYGFHVSSSFTKLKYGNKHRSKYRYPYRIFGFETDWEMWVYFIENKITPKQIVDKAYKATGRCFLRKIVESHLYRARREYRKEKENVKDPEI